MKNVIEKKREFVESLTTQERHDLYDVETVMRGPDTTNPHCVKWQIVARIRNLMGFTDCPGDVNYDAFPSFNELEKVVRDAFKERRIGRNKALKSALGATLFNADDHFKAHIMAALRTLHKLGILPRDTR